MRRAFVEALVGLAEADHRIVLLTADLGFMALEPFAEKFPERFFNVGVAEQNLIGMATGLAQAGLIPFAYSIANFSVLRPYEFIRNGPVLHGFPVRIVGVGGGVEYGQNGSSHHALEDLAVLRPQSGITLIAPADSRQALTALLETWDLPSPVYYRLGKDDQRVVPGLDGRFELGRIQTVIHGTDILMLSTGSIATEVVAAAERLVRQGISCAVVVVASFQPDPVEDLVEMLSRFRAALTVEAHYSVGGLGSLVAEVIAEHGLACRLIRCAVPFERSGLSGSEAYLYQKHGLSADALAASACRAYEQSRLFSNSVSHEAVPSGARLTFETPLRTPSDSAD